MDFVILYYLRNPRNLRENFCPTDHTDEHRFYYLRESSFCHADVADNADFVLIITEITLLSLTKMR